VEFQAPIDMTLSAFLRHERIVPKLGTDYFKALLHHDAVKSNLRISGGAINELVGAACKIKIGQHRPRR
jgi:hypothetical protein